ncbi:HAD family hydrolase [Virgibacillus soli]|uniref:HAD family hydrolase n=1 Tax=Paracerasibacillus soli TaxID=480284 RepID=UPI0035E99194
MGVVTVDFDGTLFQGNSFYVMFEAGQKAFNYKQWGTVASSTIKASALGVTRGKDAFRHAFFKGFAKTFKGKTAEQLDIFFEQLVELGAADINHKLVEEIKRHQQQGHAVIVLSGALKPFLQAFVHKVNLDVHIIGTELMFYPNGICTGETGPIIHGNEKLRRVEQWLYEHAKDDQVEVWAYADSKSDIPLLQFVNHPIIVNPKADMKEIADKRQWPIFE